jgi:chaperonin GroEL
MVERFGDRRRHCCRIRGRRAAVEEGILPGGGIALLRALKSLEGLKAANDDQQSGINIVRRALRAPARQIAENAGEDGAYIVGKLLEGDDYNHGCPPSAPMAQI